MARTSSCCGRTSRGPRCRWKCSCAAWKPSRPCSAPPNPSAVPAEPTTTDWAYAAGFVDGEGCIAIVRSFVPKRGRYYYGVHVVVANCDRDVLAWMQSVWGGYVVVVPVQSTRASPAWSWRCTGPKAKSFLNGIRPWLRIKSKQGDNPLVMVELLQRGKRTLGRAPLPQSWLDEQEMHY